jgi:hypothetical protein
MPNLQITNTECLTDHFVLGQISDELFVQTTAFQAFVTKQLFIDKIVDKRTRYLMMKNILTIVH